MVEEPDRPLIAEPFADHPFGQPGIAAFRRPGPELAGELADRILVVGEDVDVDDPDPA